MTSKVFGIGLPKTGTVSLAHALSDFGLRTIHNPWGFYKQILEEADFIWRPEEWDALVHFGTRYYRRLDEYYPDSLFILTTRPLEEWLASCERWWRKHELLNNDPDTHLSNMSTFGTRRFHTGQFGDVFVQHERAVMAYFTSRKLLRLDLSDHGNAELLARFLGRELPMAGYRYPHLNENPP